MEKTSKGLSPGAVLAGTFILSALPFVAVQIFPSLQFVIAPTSYLLFHNVAEFFSIMVSLSMFGMGWYAYDQSKDRHALFLSTAFLGIGLMDFMHTLANAAMPPFVTPNSSNKSTQFWIAVRLFQAVAFLVSAYIYAEKPGRWLSKRVLMTAVLLVSFLVFTGVTFFPDFMPATFVPGLGLTPFKRISEYLIIGTLCAAAFAYWGRMAITGDRLSIYYLVAFVICIFSELPLAVYTKVFDTYNVLGHIYKVAAFYLIYHGIYKASVKAPYLRVTEVSEKLRGEIAERRRTEEALREAHDNLEVRVEERTAELAQSNTQLRTEVEDRRKAEEALREAHDRALWLARLPDENPNPVMRVSADGTVLYCNPCAVDLPGWTCVVGQPIDYRLLPSVRRAIADDEETQQDVEIGKRFYFVWVAPFPREGYANVYGRDITERKQAEEEIRRRNKIQEAISQIFEKALTCDTEEELGRMSLSVVEELTGSNFSFIGEIGQDGDLHDIAISEPGWELCTMYDKTGHRRPPGDFKIHGLYGRVLQDGKTLLTNDPASHPDSIGVPEGHPQLTAFLGVPLIQGGKTIGMVAVGNRELGYTQEQQQDLEALAPAIFQAHLRKSAEEGLRQSERRWATTLASIGDAVIATDVYGRITFMNAVAEGLTGWTHREASQKPATEVFTIMNEQTREAADNPVGKVLREGNVVGLANHTVLIRKDGTEVAIDDSGAPIKDKGGKIVGVVLVFRDITERKRAENRLAADLAALTRMHALSRRLLAAGGLQPLLQEVMDAAVAIEGADLGTLQLLEGDSLRIVAHHGHQQPFLDFFASAESRASVCGEATKRGERVIVPDVETSPLFAGTTSLAVLREASVRAMQSTPIMSRTGLLLGILTTQWGLPYSPDEHDLWRIDLLVRQAADLIEYIRAEEALKKARDELEMRVQERTSELSEAVERLRAENIARKLLEDTLRQSEYQVRFFASQCLTAQETERKRVAGELHDSIAASLGAMKFRIEKIAEEMKQGHNSPESVEDLGSKVTDINNEVRRIMVDLRPSILDDLGIIAAMNWFCREYQKTYSHISVENQIGISEHEVPDSLKTPIFRISQEAMNNIAKHSQASFVNLSLRKEDDKIQLMIQDNGEGFDLETGRKGMGLSTMRERAQLSGGSFDLESTIGKGTIIRVSWTL